MNKFQKIFDAQKALMSTGVTRTYEWRVDQLDRMARMIRESTKRGQHSANCLALVSIWPCSAAHLSARVSRRSQSHSRMRCRQSK